MTKDEALKLALETLGRGRFKGEPMQGREQAISAIKEALAQPEQPKVRTGNCLRVGVCASEGHKIAPQRTWVGLTLDERIELAQDVDWAIGAYCEYAEKIEAKLKAKNVL